MPTSTRAIEYYDRTAEGYERLHGGDQNLEHLVALERAWPLLHDVGIESVLDVGCGTGRSLEWLSTRAPGLRLMGVEPSNGMRHCAEQRLPHVEIRPGTGDELPFPDSSVDLVMASGILHHVASPERVIREMFRVARRAVLISDHNNFAFGSRFLRRLRLWLQASGLLSAATFIKQGFSRQGYSEEDGFWYPYSLLADYALLAGLSSAQYLIPTRPVNSDRLRNFLLVQSHLAVLAFLAEPARAPETISR